MFFLIVRGWLEQKAYLLVVVLAPISIVRV
jgi:hypothetical protein